MAVTLIVNAPPLVTLTAPLANTSFTAPASVALTATATDADGSIAKLEFYNGTALLGVGTLASGVYSFNWSNVPAGSYAVTAKATDNRGAGTSTPIRTVTVASCGTVVAFSFTSLDNVDLSTSVVSNPITVAGVACATPISVTGGDYSVNGGTFVSTAGSVKNGDVVRVRVTSAPDYLQSRSALLTIGGIVSNFAVTSVAKPTITQSQLRENRVLVFVACGATDNTNAQCLTTRKSYVAQHLAGLGVESFVTSDAAEFERELRCGKYNTYWVSGGFEQLKGMIDDELAEAVYRGDGLLVDGVQDIRSDRIDLASGITYQGSLTNTNVSVFNTGNALDAGNYATVGRAAKLVLAGAQQQASFETANTTSAAKVAIATATYGAGKAMTIGFDWVASAQLATATPLLRADIAKALAFVLPALSDDQAAGSLVKLRTTVSNPAQIVSTVEVAATLPSTGQFVASNPVPSSVGGNIVRWRVDVNGQSSTKIDWTLRAPTTDSTTPISSTLSRVTGTGTSATLTAIGSAATQLTVGSYTTRSNAVRAQIAALSLTSLLEKAARDAALAYIDQAADEHARGKYDGGTRALIAANDSLDKITSVPTAVMQLQVSRMLKALAQEACANGVNPSACSTTGNFTNVSDFDYDGNDGTNVKLIRVRGGGTGSPTSGFGAGTWQVASLLKTANTQSQSTASFSYVSGRSYNWTFDYKGNGSVTFTLVDPTRQTASISTGSNWKVGNAIKLAVHADAGIGGGTVIESAVLALNGALLSGGVIATTGNNLISDISKVLSGPALTAPFKVTGTLKLTFTGSIPPTGDKLFFQITGGEGECE